MKTSWTKGLSEKEKEDIVSSFSSSATMRLRAIHLINEKIETARKARLKIDEYNSPNWAYKQADAVGYERALQEIISLFS